MNKYELLVVLAGTLDDAQATARMEQVLALVKEYATEAEIHPLGKNKLAYPIKQIRYGYFYTVVFNCEVEKIKALELKLSLERDLLRAMVTHFNTTLTTAQRIVYSTDALGVTTMIEEGNKAPVKQEEPEKELVAASPAAPVAPAAPKKAPEASIEEISKKLDDIIGGDIAPGL